MILSAGGGVPGHALPGIGFAIGAEQPLAIVMVGVVGAVGASLPAAPDGLPELGLVALAPPAPARGLLVLPLPPAPELLPVLGLVPVAWAPLVAGVVVPGAAGAAVVAPVFVLASPPSEDEPQASPALESAASRAICIGLIISVTSSSSTHLGRTAQGAARHAASAPRSLYR